MLRPGFINAGSSKDENSGSNVQVIKEVKKLTEKIPPHLSPSDSDESDAPLIKRRRTEPNKSCTSDDEVLVTGGGDWFQVHLGQTASAGEQKGSLISSTNVEPLWRTLHARAVMKIAQDRLDNYAGPNTKELVKGYLQWEEAGKQRDQFCLICLLANTDLACRTCRRVYHFLCLKPALTAGQADRNVFCPLCTKRTWSEIPPFRQSDPDDRLLVLASHLQNVDAMTWIQWRDTGSTSNDQELLYEMGVTSKGDTENSSGGDALRTKSEAEFSSEVKQERVKEEHIEVQSSDTQLEEDPLKNDDIECIRCVCGQYNLADEGRRAMICCDKCAAWQHNSCMGIVETHDPAKYFCEQCKPQEHEKLQAAVSQGEKPWELVNGQGAVQLEEVAEEDTIVVSDPEVTLRTLQPVQPPREISNLASDAGNSSAPSNRSQTRTLEHSRIKMVRGSITSPLKRLGKERSGNKPLLEMAIGACAEEIMGFLHFDEQVRLRCERCTRATHCIPQSTQNHPRPYPHDK